MCGCTFICNLLQSTAATCWYRVWFWWNSVFLQVDLLLERNSRNDAKFTKRVFSLPFSVWNWRFVFFLQINVSRTEKLVPASIYCRWSVAGHGRGRGAGPAPHLKTRGPGLPTVSHTRCSRSYRRPLCVHASPSPVPRTRCTALCSVWEKSFFYEFWLSVLQPHRHCMKHIYVVLMFTCYLGKPVHFDANM